MNNYYLFLKGSDSFLYCSSLTQIILTNGLTIIGYEMFSMYYRNGYPTLLSSIVIPSTISSIGECYYYYN